MPRDDDAVPIRREVLEARSERGVSAILLAPPLSLKRAAACAGGTLLVFGLFLVFADYTSKVHVSGELEPTAGIIQVVAPQFSRIADLYVRVGDSVKAGQVLAGLSSERVGSDDRITASLEMRRIEREQLRELTINQLAERGAALVRQQRTAEADIATHRGTIALADDQINSADVNLKRYEKLRRAGYVSPAQVDQFKTIRTTERTKRAVLTMNLNAALRNQDQLQQDIAAINVQIKLVRSESRQSLAVLDQEIAEHDGRRAMRVATPAAGIVTAIAFKQGQTVPAGAALAAILPTGSKMEAVLLVPSQALPHIEPGQQVWLRIDAFPFQKVGQQAGTVVLVDSSPIGNAAPGTEQLYRVRVALAKQTVFMDGKERQITAGMRLQASVLGDRRRLGEWLFEPLISAAQGRPR